MTLRKEVKDHLIAIMEKLLDPYMATHDFKRAKTNLIYKRRLGETTQIIDLQIYMRPTDNRNAIAAVYPSMTILMPSVDSIFDNMTGNNKLPRVGYDLGRSTQPIGITSLKEDPGRWYIYQPESVPDVVEKIRVFIEQWTMLVLDTYYTPEDVVAAYERGDRRIVLDRMQMLRVVAALVACNRNDYAQSLMNKKFGSRGLRRDYEHIFDYLQKMN